MLEEVAIILVNFNNNDDTIQCVESLYRSLNIKISIVIIDNCSEDSSALRQVIQPSRNIHIVYNEENVGFGRANNIGIKWVVENLAVNYIFLLNNDTTIDCNALNILVSRFIRTDCSVVVPKILYADPPNKIWYAGGEIDWRLGRAKSYGLNETDHSYSEGKFVTFASGCAILTKTEIFEEVGAFDDRMFMYVEDVDLSMRLGKLGHNIYFEPQAVVYHKVQGSQRRNDSSYVSGWSPKNPNLNFHLYHGVKNSIIAMQNNANFLLFIRFVILYSMFLSIKSLLFIKNGRMDAPLIMLKAIRDSLKK